MSGSGRLACSECNLSERPLRAVKEARQMTAGILSGKGQKSARAQSRREPMAIALDLDSNAHNSYDAPSDTRFRFWVVMIAKLEALKLLMFNIR